MGKEQSTTELNSLQHSLQNGNSMPISSANDNQQELQNILNKIKNKEE